MISYILERTKNVGRDERVSVAVEIARLSWLVNGNQVGSFLYVSPNISSKLAIPFAQHHMPPPSPATGQTSACT